MPTGRNLADMLLLISNHSLVPEVEVKDNRDMQILSRLNLNHYIVFRSFESLGDLQQRHLRIRRAPSPSDNFHFNDNNEGEHQRQAQLEKLFPSIGAHKKTPAVTWAERRLNAKRNLEKLLDKIAVRKHSASKATANLETKSPELSRISSKDGSAKILTEERIFQESDNPHFPKQDITVSLIDRRGDVNAKDYDYVEFGGNEKKEALGDLSDEVGFVRELPKNRYSAKATVPSTTVKSAKDMELWEMETYPKAEARHHHSSSSSYLESHEDVRYGPGDEEHQLDDGQPRNYYVNSELQMADPQYYSEAGDSPYQVLNYTADQYY